MYQSHIKLSCCKKLANVFPNVFDLWRRSGNYFFYFRKNQKNKPITIDLIFVPLTKLPHEGGQKQTQHQVLDSIGGLAPRAKPYPTKASLPTHCQSLANATKKANTINLSSSSSSNSEASTPANSPRKKAKTTHHVSAQQPAKPHHGQALFRV